jgi:hypothetical protein
MLVADPAQLRPLFMELLSWLRSPAATTSGRPLANSGVNQVQSMIQSFYTYMVDSRTEAALTLADPRWEHLTVDHTRLWAPQYGSKRTGNKTQITFIGLADTRRMFSWLDVLSSPTDNTVKEFEPPRHVRRLQPLRRMGSWQDDVGSTRRSCGSERCAW